jgi:hypothetical protein
MFLALKVRFYVMFMFGMFGLHLMKIWRNFIQLSGHTCSHSGAYAAKPSLFVTYKWPN